MSFDIITDAEKGISAIVDTEVGRALGPIGYGEDAEKLLEAFAGSFVGDITKHLPAEVERKWEQFVLELSDVQDAVEGKPPAGKVEDPTEGGSPTTPAAPSENEAAPSDPTESSGGDSGPTPDEPEKPAEAEAPSATSADDEETPVKEPKPGDIICPTCDGWRTVPQGDSEVPCPTCKGAGEVLGEQPPPEASPAS